MEQVLYFSLESEHITHFDEITKTLRYTPKCSFEVVHAKREFNNPRDLIPLIEDCEKKESLHIIIDYKTLEGEDVDKNDCAEVMRYIIMAYPEVQFLFDETCSSNEENFLKNFLFIDKSNAKITQEEGVPFISTKEFVAENDDEAALSIQVNSALHTIQIDEDDDDFALLLVKGRNNLYDASNLRSAIKAVKRYDLRVIDNYRKLNSSRRNNLAVVVEEEYHQNMFNSYCLYANGYRVFPIITATELKARHEQEKKDHCAILVRDYDLQFIDEKTSDAGVSEDFNEVDYVRGAKRNKQTKKFVLLNHDQDNHYWCNFDDKNTYFLTKGGDGIEPCLDNNKETRESMRLKNDDKTLVLNGMVKPIEGIYNSVQKIKDIRVRYLKTRYKKKHEDYFIVTKRQGKEGHSCPLDIYGIARSMVQRAEKYYSEKKYRLAALVAGESIEILNGFHPSLMKRAYYVQAVSENAMAMSLLGGEESKLIEDIDFRFEKIKDDVKRMVAGKIDRKNILNSIYNDCRIFCRDVEYLEAADEALSFLVHENEGF